MNEYNIGNKYYLGWDTYGILEGIDELGRPYFSIDVNCACFGRNSDGYYYFGPGALENLVLINDFKFLK